MHHLKINSLQVPNTFVERACLPLMVCIEMLTSFHFEQKIRIFKRQLKVFQYFCWKRFSVKTTDCLRWTAARNHHQKQEGHRRGYFWHAFCVGWWLNDDFGRSHDEDKQARRAASRSRGLEGPYTSSTNIFLCFDSLCRSISPANNSPIQ